MDYNLLWQVIGGVVTIIFAAALVRFESKQNAKDIETLKEKDIEQDKSINDIKSKNDLLTQESGDNKNEIEKMQDSINTGFKRLDTALNRITVLETGSKSHLDIREAEKKFVSKEELKLMMKNIELTADYTKQEIVKIEGKLDDILGILSLRKN